MQTAEFRWSWRWLVRQTLSVLLMAVCTIGLFFYQVPIVIVTRWLRAAVGPITELQLLHQYDWWLALITITAALIQFGVLMWLYRRQLRRANPLGIHRRRFRIESLFFLVTMYAVIIGANLGYNHFSHFTQAHNQQLITSSFNYMPLTYFVMIALLAPFLEELTFRGIFMNLFWRRNNRLNNIMACVTSALLFAFMHEQHLSLAYLLYFSLGLVLAATYRYHHDLRYSIGLHMFNNGIPAIAMLVQTFVH
ncbi:CPBP family intramembrane glutamic endopeptidase [Lacticaseibacillus thailandensis]|uniref:CAAX prenyl protease 2/Lysostaphin resistance protein A-like domain-containing protein n=1 Tax=Lacticaseibacillus thailandensis DSM 22698 = JCM 13996 TaxID=1423810 RepID=A0A0R2C5X9_9LACO|nr:CPBP family intramembrane glutamic endopeptidase [Lacticaseibacillus thailandensis]KRM87149.1 hypothetical protein FD19_GL001302 [Lacticaseibacillus thailandensis DSM 22698 = JCM 13996]